MRSLTLVAAALAFLFRTALTCAAELPSASPSDVGLSQDRLDKITTVLKNDVESKKLAGAVLLIARHGKVAYLQSVGDRDPQENAAMSSDAIFRIYSMSKIITVTAALTLAEDGLISFDDPISKYLPQFAHMNVGAPVANPSGGNSNVLQLVPARRQITVLDLMRHSVRHHLRLFWRHSGREGIPSRRSCERQLHQCRSRGSPREVASGISAWHDLGLRIFDRRARSDRRARVRQVALPIREGAHSRSSRNARHQLLRDRSSEENAHRSTLR